MSVIQYWEFICDGCKKVERVLTSATPPKWGKWHRWDEFGNIVVDKHFCSDCDKRIMDPKVVELDGNNGARKFRKRVKQ